MDSLNKYSTCFKDKIILISNVDKLKNIISYRLFPYIKDKMLE